MAWFFAHLHDEDERWVIPRPTDQILKHIRTELSERSGCNGLVPVERFASYLSDFKSRGNDAIYSRGLWGRVDGHKFELAAASGYRAHRWWVPVVTGFVEPSDEGSLVTYRLRAIQRRQLLFSTLQLLFGLVVLGLGVNIVLNGNASGLLVLALGIAILGSILLFVHSAAPMAMGMEEYLQRRMRSFIEG